MPVVMAPSSVRAVLGRLSQLALILASAVAGPRAAERLCVTAALRPYVGAPPGKVDDATWPRWFGNTPRRHTTLGTCSTGSDDAAVVDCELQVRGLDGLRLVDASVMPRIIRGQTHSR
jgi:choline dehydrogenase